MVARSVTWLHPQVGSFSAGLAAFRAARLGVCLKELHGIAGFEASALRARALLRLGDVSSALEETGSEFDGSYRDRSEIAMLRGVALSRLGKAEESDHALFDARVYAISAGDRTREAEAEYSLAFVAFGDGDLDGARSACRRGLNCSDTSTSEGGRLVVPLEHVAARLQELLGILDAADGRYREALVHARATLHTLGACEFRDVWQEAFAIANLAALVRDLDDLQPDARLVSEFVTRLQWTDELAPTQFRALESLAWWAMLRGEHVEALRLFRRVSGVTTTVPQQIVLGVGRAIHASGLGQSAIAAEEIEHGLTLSETFDWENAAGDSRVFLLELARAAAAISPARARRVLQRYSAIRAAMPTACVSRLEARIHAEEAYAYGIVLRAEGRLHASTERLQKAFHTWGSIGCAWRAACVAVELAELNAGDVFRLAIRRELRVRPDSFFAQRARLVA